MRSWLLKEMGDGTLIGLLHVTPNAPFPPAGAGRFGTGSEGAVLLRSVMACVSTANSTLMVGRGFKPDGDSRCSYASIVIS